MPRCELLESFIKSAAAEPCEDVKSQMQQTSNKTIDIDATQFLPSMKQAADCAYLPNNVAPLSEVETDTFPCMLVIPGSGLGLGFIKVCYVGFDIVI